MAEENVEWEGERVARWLRQADGLERQLAPVADVLFDAAQIAPGERVLDVGCGAGPTTRRAAQLAGPDGAVSGLDVSAAMLDAAAKIGAGAKAAPIDWVVADAVDWSPPAETYDVVISRFGVMFFKDPQRAFANLLGATKPGGRLAMATWSRRDESELFAVPLYAALAALGRDDPGFPGDVDAFGLNDMASIDAVVGRAGWVDLDVTMHRLSLTMGGGLDVAGAAQAAIGVGPTRQVTETLDDEQRAAVLESIGAALADHVIDDGHVVLEASVVITTARRRST